VVAGIFVITIVIGILVSATEESPSARSSSGSTSSSPASTAAAAARIGSTVQVGDLNLRLDSVKAFSGERYNQFNDANVAVELTLFMARGEGDYTFSPSLALQLVDSSGVVHDPTFCTSCPDELRSTTLTRGGGTHGVVYFSIPGGRDSLRELRYEPFLSRNKASFNVR